MLIECSTCQGCGDTVHWGPCVVCDGTGLLTPDGEKPTPEEVIAYDAHIRRWMLPAEAA